MSAADSPGSRGYVTPRYRAEDAAFHHFLHGTVPGHQIDFMYCPEVPQGALRPTHFGHLARLIKYIEPRDGAPYAFAIGNLSRDDVRHSPGHGGVAVMFALRVPGVVDHAGRDMPPYAHGVVAVNRELTYGALLQTVMALHGHFLEREGAEDRRGDFYRSYVRTMRESPAEVADFLGRAIHGFDDLPSPPRSTLGWDYVVDGREPPRRIDLFHDDRAEIGEIAHWSSRIAAFLYRSNIKWTSISTGREIDIAGGTAIRFVPRGELRGSPGDLSFGIDELPEDEEALAALLFGAKRRSPAAVLPARGWREALGGCPPGEVVVPPAPALLARHGEVDGAPDPYEVDVDVDMSMDAGVNVDVDVDVDLSCPSEVDAADGGPKPWILIVNDLGDAGPADGAGAVSCPDVAAVAGAPSDTRAAVVSICARVPVDVGDASDARATVDTIGASDAGAAVGPDLAMDAGAGAGGADETVDASAESDAAVEAGAAVRASAESDARPAGAEAAMAPGAAEDAGGSRRPTDEVDDAAATIPIAMVPEASLGPMLFAATGAPVSPAVAVPTPAFAAVEMGSCGAHAEDELTRHRENRRLLVLAASIVAVVMVLMVLAAAGLHAGRSSPNDAVETGPSLGTARDPGAAPPTSADRGETGTGESGSAASGAETSSGPQAMAPGSADADGSRGAGPAWGPRNNSLPRGGAQRPGRTEPRAHPADPTPAPPPPATF